LQNSWILSECWTEVDGELGSIDAAAAVVKLDENVYEYNKLSSVDTRHGLIELH
jgi:hypothetical protein